jgi:hypothetical protein
MNVTIEGFRGSLGLHPTQIRDICICAMVKSGFRSFANLELSFIKMSFSNEDEPLQCRFWPSCPQPLPLSGTPRASRPRRSAAEQLARALPTAQRLGVARQQDGEGGGSRPAAAQLWPHTTVMERLGWHNSKMGREEGRHYASRPPIGGREGTGRARRVEEEE